MPTGYTSKIETGISFREFALTCAKAFGACITLKDESSDTPIPESFVVSGYRTKNIDQLLDDLKSLEALTDKDCDLAAVGQFAKVKAANVRHREEKEALQEKYEAMLREVMMWFPPTADHKGLKTFMIDQINQSLKFDCGNVYQEDEIEMSGHDWRRKRRDKLLHDLGYQVLKQEKERVRVEGRNMWVKSLRESLPCA